MDIFNRFKQTLKIRDIQRDNEVFQLHYRVTAILLLGCAALVASKQHFGDPIDCITRDDVPNKIMDTYCWIHSTFTLPSACNKTVGIEVSLKWSSHNKQAHIQCNERNKLTNESPQTGTSSLCRQIQL